MNHYSWKRKGAREERNHALGSRVTLNLLAFFVASIRTTLRLTYSFFRIIGGTIAPYAGRFVLRFLLLPGYKLSVFLQLKIKKILTKLLPALENYSVKESSLWFFAFLIITIGVTITNFYQARTRPEDVGKESLFFKILTPEEQLDNEIITESASLNTYQGTDTLALNQPLASPDGSTIITRRIAVPPPDYISPDIALNQPVIIDYSSAQKDYSLPRSGIETYIVGDGDTLSEIADKFNISLNTLLWENGLKPYSTLRPGQKLTILPVSGVSYKALAGDTLSKIAHKFDVKAEDIAILNDLALASTIHKSDLLIIPDGKPLSIPRAPSTQTHIAQRIKNFLVSPSESRQRLFLWPTTSRTISQPFRGWRHTGVDISNHIGEPIYAAASGIVETAGWNKGGYGLYIVIRHQNGLKTLYGHTSKVFVTVGQTVSQGQRIANIGSTGRSTGPHLHFEVRSEGNFLNPLNYF